MANGDITLHPDHGVAPILTSCRLCGEDDVSIALLGNKCHKVCQEILGQPYSGSSTQRIPGGFCKRCEDALKGGAAAYWCQDGRLVMFGADWIKRNDMPNPGKVSEVDKDCMDWIQRLIDASKATPDGPDTAAAIQPGQT